MKISFKNWTLLTGAFALMLSLTSCDPFGVRSKGDIVTMNYNESDFHGVNLCVPGKTEVHVGPEFKLQITAEESALPYIETEVKNGILTLSFSRNLYDVDHLKIDITAPSWNHFDVSGSGLILATDTLEGQNLYLDVSGSGSIDLNHAYFDKSDFQVSGSGDLYVAGATEQLSADISGSGEIHAFDFIANNADVQISGSGNMGLNVVENLKADISGSGTVEYEGSPAVTAHVSGSGNIKKH